MIAFASNSLPPCVWCCARKKEVLVYNHRIVQCLKCQYYGHSHKNYKASEPVCLRCPGRHESVNCPLKNSDPIDKTQYYRHAICKGCHSSTSTVCPIRQQNRNILLMAEKFNIGYKRAQVVYRTYTQAICSNQTQQAKPVQYNCIINQNNEQIINKTISETVAKIIAELLLFPDLLDIASLPLATKVEKLCGFMNELNMGPIDSEAI